MKSAISIKDELFEYYMERESIEHFLYDLYMKN